MAEKRPTIKAQKRTVLGRKVKKLRKEGFLPANIYGKAIKSLAVQVDSKETEKIFDQVGETGLVDIIVEAEKEPKTVLFKNPQYHPVDDKLIHLDFHQVSLTEKVSAHIPVEIAGESPVVARKEGIMVQLLNEIEVEALPTDLPDKFIVDATKLEQVEAVISIADLKIDAQKVTVKSDPQTILVKIEPPAKEEEVTPPPVAEETAVPTEGAAPAEGEAPKEGATPAEGEPKAKEGKVETPKEEKKKGTERD